MKARTVLSRCLVSGMILSSLSLAAHASTPPTDTRLECGIPLDVYEATSNPSPEGIAYDYIVDENGNYILVDENGNPLPVDEEMTYNPFGQLGQFDCGMPYDVYEATSNPSPEGTVYEYTTDENGNFVLVESTPDLTEAFDPEGEPMPEGTFASPTTTTQETSGGNWFAQLFSKFLNLFTA